MAHGFSILYVTPIILLESSLTSSRTSPTKQTMILDSPNDIAERFSLLTFEMADPEQDLSVQQPGYGATTFTCFPKLPIELRLMIWRAAFPRGRMVEIDFQEDHCVYSGPPLPSTLMINQESRKETLRHYLLYYQDDELLKKVPTEASRLRSTRNVHKGPRPILYSPVRDLMFASYWIEDQSLSNALLELVAEKCKPIGKVPVLASDYFNHGPKWTALHPNPESVCVLANFHDLKEIHCIKYPAVDKWQKTEIIEALDKTFDLEREDFPCLNKPKVSFFDSIQDWKKSMRAQGW
jgi:hypothetical protein